MGHTILTVSIVTIAIFPVAAPAQTNSQAPAFEVATVKPVLPSRPGSRAFAFRDSISEIQISGTRVTARGNLTMLIAAAYGLERFQVTQGPESSDKWQNADLYDVEARAPGDATPTPAQVRQMMQNLLADRFHLTFTRNTTVTPVYNMVVAPGGPKMQPTISASDPPAARNEGSSGTQIHTRFQNFSMPDLVAHIRGQFDRPLLDRTGLAGGWDFSLEYRWQPPGMTAAAAQALGMPDPEPGTPIAASLREQLGLRVLPAKEAVEIVVIAHADRPTPN